MSDNITYNYCVESLRYIYNMIGYDNAINELNFIKHLQSKSTPVSASSNILETQKQDSVSELVKDDTKNSNSSICDNKNIIIQPSSSKYARNTIPDEDRCETILSNGKRCTFKRADTSSSNCSRHTK